jgi:MarR family 2-MHQ and catechol resistance regulon transcriptional repressor
MPRAWWNSCRSRSWHAEAVETSQDANELVPHELITLAGLLFETAAGLERRLDATLRRGSGLPVATFEVLIRLRRSPHRQMRLAQLGRELAITTGGVTRLIDRLETDGLVRRTRSGDDRRAVFAQLTSAGAQVLSGALPDHVAELDSAFAVLTPPQRTAFEEALRQLRAQWEHRS